MLQTEKGESRNDRIAILLIVIEKTAKIDYF